MSGASPVEGSGGDHAFGAAGEIRSARTSTNSLISRCVVVTIIPIHVCHQHRRFLANDALAFSVDSNIAL